MPNDLNLSNFKISTKLKSLTLNYIEQLCLNKDIYHKRFPNFICFIIERKRKKFKKNPNLPSYFTYSIWKKAECLRNNNQVDKKNFKRKKNTLHCNISKIEKKEIPKSLRKLQRFLGIPIVKQKYQIDNITATIRTGFKINLRKFEKQNRHKEDIYYNPEKFPGLRIRKNNLSYVVFNSGSINIVGGKSKKQISKGIPWIISTVPRLKKKYE